MKKDDDVDARDEDGKTALIRAAKEGDAERIARGKKVKIIIEYSESERVLGRIPIKDIAEALSEDPELKWLNQYWDYDDISNVFGATSGRIEYHHAGKLIHKETFESGDWRDDCEDMIKKDGFYQLTYTDGGVPDIEAELLFDSTEIEDATTTEVLGVVKVITFSDLKNTEIEIQADDVKTRGATTTFIMCKSAEITYFDPGEICEGVTERGWELDSKKIAKHLKMLLGGKGENDKAKSADVNTALINAAKEGDAETLASLLDQGADIEAKKDGWRALHFAARDGQTEMVELLLDRGADIEAKDNEGKTALMRAEEEGETEVAKYLKKFAEGRNKEARQNKKVKRKMKVEDAESCYDKGRQFEKDENYEEAAEWYEKAADQGHVYAQVSLGRAYSEGEGVPENKKEAAKWYEKAARQGDKFAQFCLGNAYSEGEGVPEDKKEAIKWYEKAAKQGYKFGQYSLGNAFYNGEGVPEDKKEAVKWHRKAADQGLDASQLFLGWAYENGEGVPTNHQEALKWYKLAAAQDDKDAQEAISRLSDVNQSDKDDIELVPKGKRVTYSDWSEFEKEQGEKNEQKKNNLPIAKKIHDLMFNVFSEKNIIFEIRYGDGTFSISIPKDEAKSGKRTFARVGLLSLADKCVYLDTLYRVTGTAIPPGSFTWKKNDDSQFLFRMKTIEDFEKVKNSINQSVIGSYNCLAKTKIT